MKYSNLQIMSYLRIIIFISLFLSLGTSQAGFKNHAGKAFDKVNLESVHSFYPEYEELKKVSKKVNILIDINADKKNDLKCRLNYLVKRYGQIAINGVWENNSVWGKSIILIDSDKFIQKSQGFYETTGKIVKFDNKKGYFIVFVTAHSQEWGDYQINRFSRHAFKLVSDNKIRYSGAMNFYDTLEEAVMDVGNPDSADIETGAFDIFEHVPVPAE